MRTNAKLNQELKPSVSAVLHQANGSTIGITDNNIVANSLIIREGTSNSDEFTVGGCVIGSMSVTLMNTKGEFSSVDWYDSRITLDLITYDVDGNRVVLNMGYYYVAKHHEQGYQITLECYDALKVLDEYQLHELRVGGQPITDEMWEAGISVSTLASYIAAKTNMSIAGIRQNSLIVHNPNNDQMTLRACMSYLAQMLGQYVTTDYSGRTYNFGWYGGNAIDAGTTFSHDLRTGSIAITGVTVSDYNDETVATYGSSSYQIEIADNPFIDKDNAQAVANLVGPAVVGISFRPGSATILASPAYEAGDIIKVRTGQSENIKMIITNLTYKQQVTEQITSDAPPYEGDLRIDNLAYIKKQSKKAISDELKDPESELSEAIANAGGGGTETILISAVATYPFANNWKGYADGIICEAGSISQGHPYNVGIPLQSISVPSHDAVLALATANSKKIEDIYFPITLSVNGDDMYGQFQGTAYWDDKESERVSAHTGAVIKIRRMVPATLSSYTSAKHYIGPFPMPYIESESRYKYFRRQGDHWGMV